MVVLLQQIHKDLNKNELERQISVLMQDSEVQNKSGIYGICAKWQWKAFKFKGIWWIYKKGKHMKHKVEFVQIKIVFKIGKIRNRTNGNRSYSALE